MINIYRQCGVVHVDDRIHILFIMSKKTYGENTASSFLWSHTNCSSASIVFWGLAPFYANMIIWMKSYLRHAIQLSNMIMQIIHITFFACIIIVFFVPRICFNYHINHIRITHNTLNIVYCKGKFP